MILVRVTSSNLGQVSSDCNSHVTGLLLFPKFLQTGISITTVLTDGLKRRMGLYGADTGLQRCQCFPSSAWDFSPLSSVSLKHEAAHPCSLDSQSLSPTSLKSVTSSM